MKKIIFLFIVLIATDSSFSQQTNPSPTLTKQDYLLKSKKQKTTAIILATSGVVLATTGFAMALDNLSGLFDPNDPPKFNSSLVDVLGYTGLALAGASILFFISSSKNKRKAFSISFKNQMTQQIQKSSFVYRPVPTLSLKISL